jgi:hypothetical protein
MGAALSPGDAPDTPYENKRQARLEMQCYLFLSLSLFTHFSWFAILAGFCGGFKPRAARHKISLGINAARCMVCFADANTHTVL